MELLLRLKKRSLHLQTTDTTNINLCSIVDNCETLTALTFDASSSQLLYIDEDGSTSTISLNNLISVVTDNNSNTSVQTIATHTSGDGTVTEIEETVTSILDNGNGTFTYVAEDGTSTTIGTPNSPFTSNNSSSKSLKQNYNTATINLWGTGVNYSLKNTEIENLKNCSAAIIPSDFGFDGEIEIKLVIMLEGENASNANFSLSTNNGESISHPISNKGWQYKSINNKTIATSEWKSWSAGQDMYEINLQGWINKGQTEISKAYISVRAKQ